MSDAILLHIRATLRSVRHDSAAQCVSALLQTAPAKINGIERIIRRCRALQRAKGLRDTVMSRPRGVSAISLALQATKCDSCFVQSAQTTTPSSGAAMPKACFSSNYSVSQPVPPAGKFSFYGIIVPQFFRRFLHKMMKDFLRQHRTIKAAALCGNFMS